VVAAALGLAGCGSGAPTAEAGALDGIAVGSRFTTAVVATDGGVVVVDGTAPTGGGTGLVVHAGEAAVPAPLDGPVANLGAWWTGREVVVVGLPCPGWDPATIGDTTWTSMCGSGRHVVVAFDPGERSWRTVAGGVDGGPEGGLYLAAATGERALLWRDAFPVVVLDAASGEVTVPPGLPDERVDVACPAGDTFLAVLGDEPGALGTIPGQALPGLGGTRAWLLADGGWAAVDVPPTAVTVPLTTPLACADGTVLFAPAATGTAAAFPALAVAGGGATWTALALDGLPGAADTARSPQLTTPGGQLVAWVPHGDDPGWDAFVRDGGRWRPVGSTDRADVPDPALVAVDGDDLVFVDGGDDGGTVVAP
jgi:hypothetical protein